MKFRKFRGRTLRKTHWFGIYEFSPAIVEKTEKWWAENQMF